MADGIPWRPHVVEFDGGRLAYFEAGSGEPVVFVSGGPGDSHGYLRAMAAAFANEFRCVLYDQRGTGQSLHDLSPRTLCVDALLRDLDHVPEVLGVRRVRLVGHSWGATLALLYGIRYPDDVSHLVLVGMGPLGDAAAAVASANLIRVLSESERQEFAALGRGRQEALAQGDAPRAWDLHARAMPYRARGWFYDAKMAARFAAEYAASEDRTNFTVHQLVNASARTIDWGLAIARCHPTFHTLVLYGRQDFEPIEQAFELQQQWPNVTVRLINRAGHLPWLEQPREFTQTVQQCLRR